MKNSENSQTAKKKRRAPTRTEKAIDRAIKAAYRRGFKDGREAEAQGDYRND